MSVPNTHSLQIIRNIGAIQIVNIIHLNKTIHLITKAANSIITTVLFVMLVWLDDHCLSILLLRVLLLFLLFCYCSINWFYPVLVLPRDRFCDSINVNSMSESAYQLYF